MGKQILEVVKLACARGGELLFKNLSFNVSGGAVLKVEGANGVGKTSLLRIVVGLSSPITGQVLWNGKSIQKRADSYRSNMLYLGHSDGLRPGLTLFENISFLQKLGDFKIDRNQVNTTLTSLGLGNVLHSPTSSLSKGQRRRGSLLRLFYASNKPLWVLDEPFVGLDQNGVEQITSVIDNHVAMGGLLIYSTHQPVTLRSPEKLVSLD